MPRKELLWKIELHHKIKLSSQKDSWSVMIFNNIFILFLNSVFSEHDAVASSMIWMLNRRVLRWQTYPKNKCTPCTDWNHGRAKPNTEQLFRSCSGNPMDIRRLQETSNPTHGYFQEQITYHLSSTSTSLLNLFEALKCIFALST